MAIRVAITGPVAKQFTIEAFIYVNNTSVGKGGNNKRIADVQLVQLFLHDFFNRSPARGDLLRRDGIRPSALPLTGVVDRQTILAIRAFQEAGIKIGAFTARDSLVSVPRGGLNIPGTGKIFAIVGLSNQFFLNSDANEKFNSNLEDHPLVSSLLPELVAELSVQKSSG